MPIEIRELTIRATVENASGGSSSSGAPANQVSEKEIDINLIVEKVLQILREKTER